MNAPDNGEVDEFTHKIAIQLSRAINILNPNDLLAKRGAFNGTVVVELLVTLLQ